MHNSKGFSLVELLVVIGIIAIIAGIAASSFLGNLPQYRLNGAARQIMGDLMWARMQSVSQNNRFRIVFDDDHQYTILDDDDNDNAEDSTESTFPKNLQTSYSDVTFGTITAVQPGSDPIFSPDGTLYWPSGYTIYLRNEYGTKSVVISSAGRIKIN
ncbi:MAG: type II transport protein GspH [Bacteroidetes bacterium]|nr:type II transport protein GspH [Bacteroidota bacterium]